MIVLKDTTYVDIDDFLDQTEVIGKNIPTQISNVLYQSCNTVALSNVSPNSTGQLCVTQEVRLLKHMFLQLRS
ncbi:hypothetical protein KC19_10G145800 [Ceratodon purpureus]|uniref:Uncharacterized protein n=1 Tax=Ceratodon purpureus TaxID=3225 RepID=A0A8T0GNC1_CERPU|nr:hypothetical protein KC19_10G145800 [Ceratodon purpureus]